MDYGGVMGARLTTHQRTHLRDHPQQLQLLTYLHTHITTHGYAPSRREMADHLGVVSLSTVTHHLRALERLGCIQCHSRIARAVTVLTAPKGEQT